ncbi:MAG: riboflavin biosynthesis protein RibF [Phycisphaerae bacterium]|nr:riboflavin biosynthesis protein RibF [Phycisphaerae bacterium]
MSARLIQGLQNVDDALRGGVVTVGNFDGVHRGHQSILQTARALADASDAAVAAVTFDPPPDGVLRPGHVVQRLTPHRVRCEHLAVAGADAVVAIRAEPRVLNMLPEDFIVEVLVARFAPRHVVEGCNFRFGRDRGGDVETLARFGSRHGFDVHVVEPVMVEIDGTPVRVSSTRIRRLVADGRIEQANSCLGRAFTLYGTVRAGAGHGRLLKFPTCNIDPVEQVVPADGVYAAVAIVDGARHAAAVSIGNKPTLGPAPRREVEAFLLDADGDYYDRELALALYARLRDQRRFDGAEQLSAQIAKDVARVRDICEQRV